MLAMFNGEKVKVRNALLGAVIGIVLGYIFASGLLSIEREVVSNSMDSMDHSHAMIEVEGVVAPSISIEALPDAKDGYNIHIITEHYLFTPEAANTDPVQGTGHAHIYVNGEKVARVYGEWFHLESKYLKNGENLIEVTLNANDHSEWMENGEHIADTVVVSN